MGVVASADVMVQMREGKGASKQSPSKNYLVPKAQQADNAPIFPINPTASAIQSINPQSMVERNGCKIPGGVVTYLNSTACAKRD